VEQIDTQQTAINLEHAVRISVPSNLLGKKRVFVLMPEGKKEILYLPPSETVQELLARIPDLSSGVDLTAGMLVSHDDNGKTVRTPIDFQAFDAGGANPALRDGDMLSLSLVRDYVYLSGFIPRPGRYPYHGNWTVNDYVGEAGGTTSGGNLTKAIVMLSDGSKHDAGRGERVSVGSTIYIDRSTGSKIASGLAIVGNFSALVISIVALTRR